MASGLNKPNKQTILKKTAIHQLLACYPIQKIPKLGVRLGKDKRKQLLDKLKEGSVVNMADLPKLFSSASSSPRFLALKRLDGYGMLRKE